MLRFNLYHAENNLFELFDEDEKNAPPPQKKVCTVTVCVSKVYDLNSDFCLPS